MLTLQGSSTLQLSAVTSNEDSSHNVKLEVPSPGSPGSNLKQTHEADHFLVSKSKSDKCTSADAKEIMDSRDSIEDNVEDDMDVDITFEGRYSEESSDEENSKHMKEEADDQGFEVDEGFSKDEPMIDIKVDMERSVRTGGDDEEEEDEDDEDIEVLVV